MAQLIIVPDTIEVTCQQFRALQIDNTESLISEYLDHHFRVDFLVMIAFEQEFFDKMNCFIQKRGGKIFNDKKHFSSYVLEYRGGRSFMLSSDKSMYYKL